jgi:transglutaminase-like putative cysteine protease
MATAQHQPDAAALNWIIASALLVMAPLTLEMPLWLAFAVAGLLALRYGGLHHNWYQPGRIVRFALAAFLAGAVFKEYGTLLGRDAGMAMLAGLVALKFLEARTIRDYMLVIFLLYLMIAGDFFYSQSLGHGGYMVLGILACTASMVRLNLDHARLPQFSFRLAGTMLLKALPIMLIMYFLFPRLQGGLWGLPSDAYAGRSGLSDRMNPGSIQQLSLNTDPAFRVEFDGDIPPNRDLYWRALIMWDTDGVEWSAGKPLPLETEEPVTFGTPVDYTITLEPSNKPWLPSLDRPKIAPKLAFRRTGYLVQGRTLIKKRVRYRMQSQAQQRTGSLAPLVKERALALPPTVSARVRTLANSWRTQYRSDRDVAQAALRHFNRNEFSYTLEPPLLGQNPVDEFLFESRQGFCEHYATSFATLMRAAGIPTRIVVGYQGGEYNQSGDYLIVRHSDAHSWNEIWLPNEGWVRVDPTAAIAPERIELGIDAVRRLREQGLRLGGLSPEMLEQATRLGALARVWQNSRMLWDSVNLQWYRWVSDYGWDRQEKLLNSLGVYAPTWLGMIAGLLGAVAVFTFGIAWAMRLRRQPKDPVVVAYNKFIRKLAKAGMRQKPSEGAEAFGERVASKLPDKSSAVLTITNIYNELRYGEGSKELLARMQKLVKEFELPKKRTT